MEEDMMLQIFFLIIIILFVVVPITNVILFIVYFLKVKKIKLKYIVIFLPLYLIEAVLFLIPYISPIKDGGVLFQALLAEVLGIIIIILQLIFIRKA